MNTITWEQLTKLQRETLQEVKHDQYVAHMPNTLKVLLDLGLIEAVASYMGVEGGYSNYRYTLTDAGRAVLAQKPAAKTVKLRVPSADGLYYETMYTDGTWEGEESK